MIIEQREIPQELYFQCMGELVGYESPYREACRAVEGRYKKERDDNSNPIARKQFLEWHNATQLLGYSRLLAILRLNGPLQGIRVLELACHNGLFLEFLRAKDRMTPSGIDTNREAVEFGKKQADLDLKLASAISLPPDLGQFPVIISRLFFTQEYWASAGNLPDYLQQAYQHILQDGVLISSMSNFPRGILEQSPFSRAISYSPSGEEFVLLK